MMQLTQATAERLDIDDRTDPLASILGGAEYLRRSMARITLMRKLANQKPPVARQVACRPRPACSIDGLDSPRITAAG
jgi:hypothetical protein